MSVRVGWLVHRMPFFQCLCNDTMFVYSSFAACDPSLPALAEESKLLLACFQTEPWNFLNFISSSSATDQENKWCDLIIRLIVKGLISNTKFFSRAIFINKTVLIRTGHGSTGL